MNTLILVIFLSFLALNGCTSARDRRAFPTDLPQSKREATMRSYLAGVVRYDGINVREAVTLARSELIFRGYEKAFHVDDPHIEYVNADNWGVRFYPINHSAADVRKNASVLVVIDKENGSAWVLEDGLAFMFREE